MDDTSRRSREGPLLRWWRQRRGDRHRSIEIRVLAALRSGQEHVYPMTRTTGVRPGELYPALVRLEGRGLVTSGWEHGPYPRRRWYRLSDAGRKLVER
jgi:DNA-binding PadR family transcriptional regulator